MCLQKRFKRDSNAGTFLDILNFLETATPFSLSSLKSPFVKKRWEKKKQWSQFSCWFTQQFHEEQSAEAYSLWRRNNKAKEGCVPLRINQRATWRGSRFVCTTSLEHKELNKWSHDQDKSEVEIQQTGSQKAASFQGNSYSLASITTFPRKFLKPAQVCKSLGESAFHDHWTLIQLTTFYLAWMFYSITLTHTSDFMWPGTIHRKKPPQIRSPVL